MHTFELARQRNKKNTILDITGVELGILEVYGSILPSVFYKCVRTVEFSTVRYGTFTYGTVLLLYCYANRVFWEAILEE